MFVYYYYYVWWLLTDRYTGSKLLSYCIICIYIAISLSTLVLNSRDSSGKNGIQNFGASKTHLRIGFTQNNLLKCIGTTIIATYLC